MEESKPRPRIIPVMDIRGGVVVRAIAGRREEYKPLVSRLTDSTDPLVVAEALRRATGTDELYLADLGAIASGKPELEVYRCLAESGRRLIVDAGVRSDGAVETLFGLGVHTAVLALETLVHPVDLKYLVGRFGTQRIAFSVDLKEGAPIHR